jgi:hypothetical protein
MKNYKQDAENIAQAISYYNSIDTLRTRLKNVLNNYKKSDRRLILTRALREKRYNEMSGKFQLVADKFNVPFEKINQIINGQYSLEIKFDKADEQDPN